MGSGRTWHGVTAIPAVLLIAAGAVVAMGSQAGAATWCQVFYTENSWATGFAAKVTITNLGDDPWGFWELKYAYAGNERLVTGWNGVWSRDGQNITVRNDSWNGVVGPGKSVEPNASFLYTAPPPHAFPVVFNVNGVTCTSPRPTAPAAPPG